MKANILLICFLIMFQGLIAQRYSPYRSPVRISQENPYDEPGDGYFPNDPDCHLPQQRIQVALILDVSGSMNGLIRQAKSQLWNIVNNLVYDHEYPPVLEIALIEYGKNRWGYHRAYMKQLTPFSQDLDGLSDLLFKMRTGGNKEYSGAAIQLAVNQLDWSPYRDDLKLIFIAGNESFNQGPVPFQRAIRQAKRKGIIVNTVFCGDYRRGVSLGWQDAAQLAGGDYVHIDHNHHVYHIPTPYDHQLYQLNVRLNQTYIPYGSQGRTYQQRQRRQDRYAQQIGMSHQSQRTLAKASSSYHNPDWDLIDGVSSGKINLRSIPKSELPVEMRHMSARHRQAYIRKKQAERHQIQQEIIALGSKRKKAVKKQETRNPRIVSKEKPVTLDKAIIKSVRQQREKQNLAKKSPRRLKTPVHSRVNRRPESPGPQKNEEVVPPRTDTYKKSRIYSRKSR